MPTAFDQEIKNLSITVAPATSSSVTHGVRFSQEHRTVIVKPPSPTAKYRLLVDYHDGFPCRRFPDSGKATGTMVKDSNFLLVGVFSIYITEADTAGDYQIRFVGVKLRT